MIVSSNAFVFSTCLLVVVSRYGCMDSSYNFPELSLLIRTLHLRTESEVFYTHEDFPIVQSFRIVNLGAVTLKKIP